jgi:quercetin dioxygenase-like cupin family protein
MVETVYKFSRGDEKAIEKVVFDENLNYIHVVFGNGDGLPEHNSNANVYMTVLRGTLSIGLGEQEIHDYEAGTLLKIPEGTKMNVKNLHPEVLEIIIVKAPAPKN